MNRHQTPAQPFQINRQQFNDRCSEDGLPCIQLAGDVPLRSLSDQAMAALRTRNKKERFVFQRSVMLVHIRTIEVVDNQGRPVKKTVIEEVNQDALRGMLARSINFVKFGRNGQTVHYDKETAMVYQPDPDLDIPYIPEFPTQEDARNAVDVIMEALIDFPYDSDASEANAVAGMLTPIVRPALGGHVPLELIDATRAGTGKSLLSDTVAYVGTGRKAAFKSPPQDNAEWRKTITSTLMEGTAVNIIDNVRSKLDSAALDALITSHYWSDRLLGTNDNGEFPNKGIWIATGNNITLGGDLPRRCYIVRLDAGVAKPWQRTGTNGRHKFLNLETWLPENRGRLIAALLTIARAWYVAGKPGAPNLPVFGSFEDWTYTIGGMLHYAGVLGFLDNLDSFQDEADYVTERNRSTADFKIRLGIAFKKREGTVFDDSNRLCLKRDIDSHTKTTTWQVVTKQRGNRQKVYSPPDARQQEVNAYLAERADDDTDID